jgi:hypothetical protein
MIWPCCCLAVLQVHVWAVDAVWGPVLFTRDTLLRGDNRTIPHNQRTWMRRVMTYLGAEAFAALALARLESSGVTVVADPSDGDGWAVVPRRQRRKPVRVHSIFRLCFRSAACPWLASAAGRHRRPGRPLLPLHVETAPLSVHPGGTGGEHPGPSGLPVSPSLEALFFVCQGGQPLHAAAPGSIDIMKTHSEWCESDGNSEYTCVRACVSLCH